MTDTLSSKKEKLTIQSPVDPKNHLWGFLAFLFFVFLITVLYLQNRSSWNDQLNTQQTLIDSLVSQTQLQSDQLSQLATFQEARVESIQKNTFDSFDADRYRIYGLFRSQDKSLSRESISQRFNVYNAGAIKYSDVLSERWFIVPVKGAHYVREGESASQIAKLYYGSANDSTLLIDFNPTIEPNRTIFLPFSD